MQEKTLPPIDSVFETVLKILENGHAMFMLRDLTVFDTEHDLRGGFTVKMKGDKYSTQEVVVSQLLAKAEIDSIAKRIHRRGYTLEDAYRFLAQTTTKIERARKAV